MGGILSPQHALVGSPVLKETLPKDSGRIMSSPCTLSITHSAEAQRGSQAARLNACTAHQRIEPSSRDETRLSCPEHRRHARSFGRLELDRQRDTMESCRQRLSMFPRRPAEMNTRLHRKSPYPKIPIVIPRPFKQGVRRIGRS